MTKKERLFKEKLTENNYSVSEKEALVKEFRAERKAELDFHFDVKKRSYLVPLENRLEFIEAEYKKHGRT